VPESVEQSTAGRRFTFLLTALFAGGALLVTTLGFYGVIGYLVAERSHEVGVRMAVGAQRFDILRLVLGHAARLIILGLAVGIAVSLVASRLLTAQLFGIQSTDSITYAGVTGVLSIVAFAASALPAIRAGGVNPAQVLRADG
jgi:ABC-type antimicrobial peptide transport system permease subunit